MPRDIVISEGDWFRFLWTFALSDHMGDASEAVHAFATLIDAPMPPDDCELSEWLPWIESWGINEGVHGALSRRKR